MKRLIAFLREKLRRRDKYDEAIDYLVAHPDNIYEFWLVPRSDKLSCLFQRIGDLFDGCGCLTQVKADPMKYRLLWPDMTVNVLADELIPADARELERLSPKQLRKVLNRFAYYQREADRRGRKFLSSYPSEP